MIYDCFIFYNELLMLDFRLRQLDSRVDRFILVEATRTFSGEPKPLTYNENKHLFREFADKIEHVIVDDMPTVNNAWVREIYQRNAMLRGLQHAKDEDVILMSDVDEIPDLDVILSQDLSRDIFRLQQKFYYYYFNLRAGDFHLASVSLGKNLRISPQEIRSAFHMPMIDNAGWHFSYLMSPEQISQKISAFSHQELNTPQFNSVASIDEAVKTLSDLYGRGYPLTLERIDESFPKQLIDNLDKYSEFIVPQHPQT